MVQKKKPTPHQQLSFQTRLQRIASGMDYFAVSIPLTITRTLGTRGPVPVVARVNDSEAFVASLYPVGGGRHFLRVRNKICKAAKIEQGDRVEVQITVRDLSAEVTIPRDVMDVLRTEGVVENFKALPIGRRSYLLRWIDKAVKPVTREKRIRAAVEESRRRSEHKKG